MRKAVYVGLNESEGALEYIIVNDQLPTDKPSPAVSYRFRGNTCIRTVVTPEGRVLSVQIIGNEGCSCGDPECSHPQLAQEKLEWARNRATQRGLPPEAMEQLEDASRDSAPRENDRDQEYDGGFEGAVDTEGTNVGALLGGGDIDRDAVEYFNGVSLPASSDSPNPAPSTYLRAHCAEVPADVVQFAPLVEEILHRVLVYAPRIIGGYEDAFQEGMITALQEAPKARAALQKKAKGLSGTALDAAVRRWVEKAVRHRLIDLVRRQDAAARNVPSASLEAMQDAGIDVADDGGLFSDLFRPYTEKGRRSHKARLIALYIMHKLDGSAGDPVMELAREVVTRHYHAAFGDGYSGPTAYELRDHPQYREADAMLQKLWAEALTAVSRGWTPPTTVSATTQRDPALAVA
jgi:DNA-directed RNA polymerase specialized sigma24 family protein